ncbi:hypothetical protein F4824DRAFT_464575 [Ustulina deusta]|nr:hypothetical protein F4824DRAFT_464575 [Ustulina deusta]
MNTVLERHNIHISYSDVLQPKSDTSYDGPKTYEKFKDIANEAFFNMSARRRNKILGDLFAAAFIQQTAMDDLIDIQDGQVFEPGVISADSRLLTRTIHTGQRLTDWWVEYDEASPRDEWIQMMAQLTVTILVPTIKQWERQLQVGGTGESQCPACTRQTSR